MLSCLVSEVVTTQNMIRTRSTEFYVAIVCMVVFRQIYTSSLEQATIGNL